MLNDFKSEMKSVFQMSDLGPLSYYLGIEVHQSKQGITISQGAYAEKVLEKAGLGDCNHCCTPMEARLHLSKEGATPRVDDTVYRSLIGSLRYLVNTRPDLAYSVGYASRFMEKPREEHMNAVKRILRYVAGTKHWGVTFTADSGGAQPCLVGFSDSDMAGDPVDRKSTSGMIYFLSNNPITWQSSKQKVVALSSCEAEYIAASAAACQGVWLARLMGELLGTEVSAPLLMVDNKAAISLVKNHVLHDRSKHIETKFHYIRECAERGQIKVEFINTTEQLGDIFTKALGRVKFEQLRSRIGVHQIK
jgi:hypothetical protein